MKTVKAVIRTGFWGHITLQKKTKLNNPSVWTYRLHDFQIFAFALANQKASFLRIKVG